MLPNWVLTNSVLASSVLTTSFFARLNINTLDAEFGHLRFSCTPSAPRRARTPSRISRGQGTGGEQGQARIAASVWSSRPRRPYARISSSPKDRRGILAQGGRHSEGMSQRRGSGNGIRLYS
jgi:hypothetical protein